MLRDFSGSLDEEKTKSDYEKMHGHHEDDDDDDPFAGHGHGNPVGCRQM